MRCNMPRDTIDKRRYSRNNEKMNLYRKAMNFCCDANCKFGYGLEVHHILPLNRNGADEYKNYIVLCFTCHRKKHVHSQHSNHQIRLLTYKFYYEKLFIGQTSDDCSELAFHNALMEFLATDVDAREMVYSKGMDFNPNEIVDPGAF